MTRFRGFLTIGALGAVLIVVAQAISGQVWQREPNGGRVGNPEGAVPVLAAEARVADVPVYLDAVGTVRAFNMVLF
jgi:multidrug efflux system membrane fusion protein